MTVHWHFDGLARARALQLDAARLDLARMQRNAADRQDVLDQHVERHADEVGAIALAWQERLDPLAHAGALARLVNLAGDQQHAREQLARAQQEASAARAVCMRCDVQLALLDKLRHRFVTAREAEGARRLQKEADLAWLAKT